jgi:adenosine deaminase
VEDTAVLAQAVASGVTLEVCPSSNVGLGVYPDPASVPLRGLLDAGAQVALGADDPLLFGPRLAAQYESARGVHGLGDVELAGLARMSVQGSTAPSDIRASMLAGIDDWLAQCPDARPLP